MYALVLIFRRFLTLKYSISPTSVRGSQLEPEIRKKSSNLFFGPSNSTSHPCPPFSTLKSPFPFDRFSHETVSRLPLLAVL